MRQSEVKETVTAFRNRLEKMAHYNEALALVYWDLRTGAPKKGVEQRSKVIGTLTAEVFDMQTSAEMGSYLQTLGQPEVQGELDAVTRRAVEKTKKEFDKYRKIPRDTYREYVELTSIAESVWEEAKANADF